MKDHGTVLLPKLNGCRLKSGSCRALRDFVHAVCAECRAEEKKTCGPTANTRETSKKLRCLTLREAEMCSLLARRLSSAEIAACLLISRRTVEKHIEGIFKKLGVRSREQLRQKLGVGAQATTTFSGRSANLFLDMAQALHFRRNGIISWIPTLAIVLLFSDWAGLPTLLAA